MRRIKSISQWFLLPAGLFLLILAARAADSGVTVVGTTTQTDGPPQNQNVRAVPMCDGQTKLLVSGGDVPLSGKMPEPVARDVAEQMMERYNEMKAENGEILLAHGKVHTQREMMIWETEMTRVIDEGYKTFHISDLGTNGVSCDMCHPDASNTHPETYPKFQTQLKKVVLLRDMINWCIENPLEGQKLSEDDPRLKAVEAYILWARRGVPLDAGKH
jgi:thiosulfate dehydrogenase